jgi:hypothetical protein
MQSACAMLSSVTCPALQYFSTLSNKRHDFRKEVIEYKMCVRVSLHILSENFFILRRSKQYMIENVYWCPCTVPSMYSARYSCQILVKLEFSRQIFEIFSKIKFHENPSSRNRVVSCGLTDGRTDRHDEPNNLFRYFTNAPKTRSK